MRFWSADEGMALLLCPYEGSGDDGKRHDKGDGKDFFDFGVRPRGFFGLVPFLGDGWLDGDRDRDGWRDGWRDRDWAPDDWQRRMPERDRFWFGRRLPDGDGFYEWRERRPEDDWYDSDGFGFGFRRGPVEPDDFGSPNRGLGDDFSPDDMLPEILEQLWPEFLSEMFGLPQDWDDWEDLEDLDDLSDYFEDFADDEDSDDEDSGAEVSATAYT